MTTSPPFPHEPALTSTSVRIRDGGVDDLDGVMDIMNRAFPAALGEAWTRSQCAGILPLCGVALRLAERDDGTLLGFALDRCIADEAELLLIAVAPTERGAGTGRMLIEDFVARAKDAGATRLHLEVREGNQAERLYHRLGFETVGRRVDYYKGPDGHRADALTLLRQQNS